MNNRSYSESFNVRMKDCISDIDSTLPNLLGTYILVKWMEIVCAKNINQHLSEAYITVGENISIEHSGMVKLNESVQINSLITKEEKRIIIFKVEAISNGKLIASALHQRVKISSKVISRLFDKNN